MAHPDLQPAAERYVAAPSPAARAAVVRAATPLVRSLVGRLNVPDNPLATPEDLESTALLGLLQALDTYDPTRGAQFATHAYRRIHGALVDYLRSIDVLSGERRQRVSELHAAANVLRQVHGAEPSDRALAEHLGVGLDEVHARLSDAHLRFTLSLSAPVGDDEDGGALSDLLEDDSGLDGFEAVEQAQLVERLQHEIARLPERQQAILGLHYLEGLTLKEIGKVLGISDARVCQVMGQAHLALRGRLTAVRPALAA